MASESFWSRFRRWRRHRPFWGSVFVLLSGLELFYTANMDLGNLQIHVGPQGFLSYLLPIVMLVCGVLCMFTPMQRLFYGIISLLAALYSFIGLNLGGFFLGMLFGIIGGALVIAWGPPRAKPGQDLADLPPDGEPIDHTDDEPQHHDVGTDVFGTREDEDADERPTEAVEVAGHDDRPHEDQPQRALRDALPAASAPREGAFRGVLTRRLPFTDAFLSLRRRHPRVVTVGLAVAGVTASLLVAGSRLPASADTDCPAGLPSRSTSASASTSAAASAAAKAATKKATTAAPSAASASAAAKKTTTTSASPSASASSKDSNPIVDGINGIVDGISNLLGVNGDDSSASPSESPSPSESATTEPAKTTEPTATATATATSTATDDPSGATTAPTKATSSATVEPTASGDTIPCLGARVYGKTVEGEDLPFVAEQPGLMETASLTMYNSTYDGVATLITKSGKQIKALQFSMDKAVNKPFSLTVNEANGDKTVSKTPELTVQDNVKFFTQQFKGNLFGLIPVTFTPESPPPLTLPVLWFTDVNIQLNLVQCDKLIGDGLDVSEVG